MVLGLWGLAKMYSQCNSMGPLSYLRSPASNGICALNGGSRKYSSKLNDNKCLTGDVFSSPYPVKICSSKVNFHFLTDRFGPYFWIIILMRSLSPAQCFIIIFMTCSCNHT